MKGNSILNRIRRFLAMLSQQAPLAIMATVVSTCALCVSFYQAHLARLQQFASVWPYVSVGGHNSSNGNQQAWGITVANNGLGPAIVEGVTVRFKDNNMSFQTMIDTFVAQYSRIDSLRDLNYAVSSVEKGVVIPAGEKIEWLSVNLIYHNQPRNKIIFEHLQQIELTVRYKSLYGEVWESCMRCRDGEEPVVKLK